MRKVAVKRIIQRPVEEVWPLLSDFANTHTYNPEVLSSRSINGKSSGLGAVRRCEFDPQGNRWTQEEIVEFDEAERMYVLEIKDGPAKPPIDKVAVEMSATSAGPNETEVTATARLSGWGVRQNLMAWVGGFALRPVLGRVLAGLDHYLETGEKITGPAKE